jgi:hypothetical protein
MKHLAVLLINMMEKKIMSKRLKNRILIIIIIISSSLCGATCTKNAKLFKDFYDFDNVYKAEATPFRKDNWILIDHKELIKTIECSEPVLSKFRTYTEVLLYTREDGMIYKLYFSKSYLGFSLNRQHFKLSKKKAKEISKIINFSATDTSQ